MSLEKVSAVAAALAAAACVVAGGASASPGHVYSCSLAVKTAAGLLPGAWVDANGNTVGEDMIPYLADNAEGYYPTTP